MSLPINPSQSFNAYSRPASTSPNLASPVEVDPTTPATSVSGEQPASAPVQQYLTPKNLLIVAGGVAALIIAGLGIRNCNWEFLKNSSQNKALQNKVAELEEALAKGTKAVAEATQNTSEAVLNYRGGNPFEIKLGDDYKELGVIQSLMRKFDKRQRPSYALNNELLAEGFTNKSSKYYLHNKPINGDYTHQVRQILDEHIAENTPLDFQAILDKNPHLQIEDRERIIRLINFAEGTVSIIPKPPKNKWTLSSIPFSQVQKWVNEGRFVLPPNKKLENYNRKTTFSIAVNGFPTEVYRQGKARCLRGLLQPN
jgi:hypothetical protein